MLQGRPHLYLEARLVDFGTVGVAVQALWDAADVVQGVVAEAVQVVNLALVGRVGPVYVKHVAHKRGHAVHVVAEEGDDARPHEVGDVCYRLVLVPLAYQLAHEALRCLYPSLYGRYLQVVVAYSLSYAVQHYLLHAVQYRAFVHILVKDELAAQSQFVVILSHSVLLLFVNYVELGAGAEVLAQGEHVLAVYPFVVYRVHNVAH